MQAFKALLEAWLESLHAQTPALAARYVAPGPDGDMPPLLEKPAGGAWLTDAVAFQWVTSPSSLDAFCSRPATLTGLARCAALVEAPAMADAMGPICRKRMMVKPKPGRARSGGGDADEEGEDEADELAGEDEEEDESKEKQPLPRSAVKVSAAAAEVIEGAAIHWKVRASQPKMCTWRSALWALAQAGGAVSINVFAFR